MNMKKLKGLFKFGGTSDFGKLTPVVSVIGILFLIGLWWLEAKFEVIPTKILPGPFDVLGSYPGLVTENSLFGNLWFTVKLNLLAYFWAILISLIVGFALSLIPFLNLALGKYLSALRYTPLPSISGVFIAVAGLTFGMKVSFLAAGLIIFILPAVAAKVNELQNPTNDSNIYLETMETLGGTSWQKFRYVYFPYVTSTVSQEIITLTGVSYSYCVIAELLYKSGEGINGVGSLINTLIRQSHMPEAWACLFLIIAVGVLQDFLFKKLDIALFPFKYNKKSIWRK